MKNKSILFLFLSILFVLLFSVGCTTTKGMHSLFTKEEITEPKITNTPVNEVAIATPVTESVSKPVKEETPAVSVGKTEKNDFTYAYFYEYAGYKIDIELHNGYGYVTYPTIISNNDILVAAGEFTKAHGDFGVSFSSVEPGKLYATYPENLTKADFDYVAQMAASDLDWYLNQMFKNQ